MSVGQLVYNFGQEWNVSVCKIAITFSTDIHGPQRLSAFDFGALFVSFPSATTRFRCLAVIEVSEQLLHWLAETKIEHSGILLTVMFHT